MTPQEGPAAKPECEHYWAYHVYGHFSVRLCQICHEPDWAEFSDQLAEAERKGELAERERIAQLAEERKARYPVTYPGEDGYLSVSPQPFADLIREQP